MAKQPETRFSEKVRDDLTPLAAANVLWFAKIQQVGIRGTPDYLLCVRGRFVALELKREKGLKADPLQTYNCGKINSCGGISFVANPENWGEILEKIKTIS